MLTLRRDTSRLWCDSRCTCVMHLLGQTFAVVASHGDSSGGDQVAGKAALNTTDAFCASQASELLLLSGVARMFTYVLWVPVVPVLLQPCR